MAGVIPRDRLDSFHRIIYMALRGNCFLQQVEIPEPLKDPATVCMCDFNVIVADFLSFLLFSQGEPINKNVFVVFFSGPHAQSKIQKICESFGANLYPFPEAPAERRATLEQVESRLATLDTVISRTADLRERALRNLGAHILGWAAFIAREKAIFATMNLLSVDASARCLIAEGWVPKIDLPVLQAALQRAQVSGPARPSLLALSPAALSVSCFGSSISLTTMLLGWGIPLKTIISPAAFDFPHRRPP